MVFENLLHVTDAESRKRVLNRTNFFTDFTEVQRDKTRYRYCPFFIFRIYWILEILVFQHQAVTFFLGVLSLWTSACTTGTKAATSTVSHHPGFPPKQSAAVTTVSRLLAPRGRGTRELRALPTWPRANSLQVSGSAEEAVPIALSRLALGSSARKFGGLVVLF